MKHTSYIPNTGDLLRCMKHITCCPTRGWRTISDMFSWVLKDLVLLSLGILWCISISRENQFSLLTEMRPSRWGHISVSRESQGFPTYQDIPQRSQIHIPVSAETPTPAYGDTPWRILGTCLCKWGKPGTDPRVGIPGVNRNEPFKPPNQCHCHTIK